MKEKRNSEAKIKANNKYNSKAYDRINIAIPKGRKQAIEIHAKTMGKTVNGLLNDLIRSDMGLSVSEWNARTEE